MKFRKLFILLAFFSASSQADAVLTEFKQIEQDAVHLRTVVVQCYVQMKMKKAKGWQSQQCQTYQDVMAMDGVALRANFQRVNQDFNKRQNSGRYSTRQTTQAMELIYSIKGHLDGIKSLPAEIKEIKEG